MSTQLIAQPGGPKSEIPPDPIAIASSTNASPIAVTTSTPHGMNEGEYAIIAGHLVNTAANGVWQAHVVSASTITLIGSTGNGVGAATGSFQSAGTVPFTIPDDNDDLTAASVNVAFEALADLAALLWLNTNWALTIRNGGTFAAASGSASVWATGSTSTFNGTTTFASGNVFFSGGLTAITFSNDVLFNIGSTFTFDGPAVFNGLSSVNGASTFNGAATFNGTTSFTNTNAFTGAVAMSGTTTLTGATSLDGTNTVTGPTTFGTGDVVLSATGGTTKMSGTSELLLGVRTYYVVSVVPPFAAFSAGVASKWQVDFDGTATCTDVTGNISLPIPIDVPDGTTLQLVDVTITGAGTHGVFPGGAPANMPTLKVFRIENNIGAVSPTTAQIGSTTTDTSATASVYEHEHVLRVTMSEVIDRTTRRYYALLTSESGANSIAGSFYIQIAWQHSPTHYSAAG